MSGAELWGYIVGAIGMLIGLAGWLRNNRGDATSQATWTGNVSARLDNLAHDLAHLNDVRERIAMVEATLRALHTRMDSHIGCEDQP